jgi:hypothetical protein
MKPRYYQDISYNYETKCKTCSNIITFGWNGSGHNCINGYPYTECNYDYTFGNRNLCIGFHQYTPNSFGYGSEKYFYDTITTNNYQIDSDDVYFQPFSVILSERYGENIVPDFFIEPMNLIVETRGLSSGVQLEKYQSQIQSLINCNTILTSSPPRNLRYMLISVINSKNYDDIYGTSFITDGDGCRKVACIAKNDSNNSFEFGSHDELCIKGYNKIHVILGFEDYKIKLVDSRIIRRLGFDINTDFAENIFSHREFNNVLKAESVKYLHDYLK